MRRFELGMSIEYARDWGIAEAVREFFQNARDEERENPQNKMFLEYKDNILTIGNASSKLLTKSLLLGATTKTGKDYLVGQHGEGYKVATVVLMRNNVKVRIYNNETKEVWESKIVKSKRYGCDIVVFDITPKIFNKDHNLVIELDGIYPEVWNQIKTRNLFLKDDIGETKESDKGRVLLKPEEKGNIYVDGLYVCTKPHFSWGYDFVPDMIKLDRDRGLVDSFDLNFATSRLLAGVKDTEFLRKNLEAKDMQFLPTYSFYLEDRIDLSNKVYKDFTDTYGEDAVPVSSNNEFNMYHSLGCKPVMVSSQVKGIINEVPREEKTSITKNDKFLKWYKEASEFLPERLLEEITELWNNK